MKLKRGGDDAGALKRLQPRRSSRSGRRSRNLTVDLVAAERKRSVAIADEAGDYCPAVDLVPR